MPFGYSDKIFKYPAVQYIPLNLYDMQKGNYSYSRKNVNFNIFSPPENWELNIQLNKIAPENNNYIIKKQQLAILILNGIVDIIKYRAHEVLMVGNIKPGKYQLFKITDRYFYKRKLLFSFYNGKNGERITHEGFISERLN